MSEVPKSVRGTKIVHRYQNLVSARSFLGWNRHPRGSDFGPLFLELLKLVWAENDPKNDPKKGPKHDFWPFDPTFTPKMVSRDLENKRRLRYRNCMKTMSEVPKSVIFDPRGWDDVPKSGLKHVSEVPKSVPRPQNLPRRSDVYPQNGLPRLREQTKTEVPKLYDKGTKKHDLGTSSHPPVLGFWDLAPDHFGGKRRIDGKKWPLFFIKTAGFYQILESWCFCENRWWGFFWPSKMTKIGPPNLGWNRHPWGPKSDPCFWVSESSFEPKTTPKNDPVLVGGPKNTFLRWASDRRSTTFGTPSPDHFGGKQSSFWTKNDPKNRSK